ncbi:MAG TPA: hypothetical protein VNZ86_05460 [Bacteroidia bacterium]|jgi:hypothetical protein|nr:hypothetical protein [Bacteroidia bacterium]
MTLQTDITRTAKASVWLDEEGFLWVKPDKGVELDGDDVLACFEVYRQLGCHKNNRVWQVMDGTSDFTMTREARENAALYGEEFFKASAMITESLAIRLIVNFFNRFYKIGVPFRSFPSEAEAKLWLRTQKG